MHRQGVGVRPGAGKRCKVLVSANLTSDKQQDKRGHLECDSLQRNAVERIGSLYHCEFPRYLALEACESVRQLGPAGKRASLASLQDAAEAITKETTTRNKICGGGGACAVMRLEPSSVLSGRLANHSPRQPRRLEGRGGQSVRSRLGFVSSFLSRIK